MDRYETFWGALIFAVLAGLILYLIPRLTLRRFKFSKKDTKAAGLNRAQARRFLAGRRKNRAGKRSRF